MKINDDPFAWVHSTFAWLASIILFFAGFIYVSFKPEAPLSTFIEGTLALDGLFWLKQYGKGKQDIEKIKLNGNGEAAGKTGDPLA